MSLNKKTTRERRIFSAHRMISCVPPGDARAREFLQRHLKIDVHTHPDKALAALCETPTPLLVRLLALLRGENVPCQQCKAVNHPEKERCHACGYPCGTKCRQANQKKTEKPRKADPHNRYLALEFHPYDPDDPSSTPLDSLFRLRERLQTMAPDAATRLSMSGGRTTLSVVFTSHRRENARAACLVAQSFAAGEGVSVARETRYPPETVRQILREAADRALARNRP